MILYRKKSYWSLQKDRTVLVSESNHNYQSLPNLSLIMPFLHYLVGVMVTKSHHVFIVDNSLNDFLKKEVGGG